MDLKKEQIKFTFYILGNIAISTLNSIYGQSIIYISSLIFISHKYSFKKYIKSISISYILFCITIFSNSFFSINYLDSKIFNIFYITGLLRGLLIAEKFINICNIAYIYRQIVSYYTISHLFYNTKIFSKLFKTLSILIILIFMFLERIKYIYNEYNTLFLLRFTSKARHPIKFIINFCIYLFSNMIKFIDDVIITIENRLDNENL